MHDSSHTPGRNPSTGNDSGAAAPLVPLHDLLDYRVAAGDPDVRGWTVRAADGIVAGKVEDLIVDTSAMRVRLLDVRLDDKALELDQEGREIAAGPEPGTAGADDFRGERRSDRLY